MAGTASGMVKGPGFFSGTMDSECGPGPPAGQNAGQRGDLHQCPRLPLWLVSWSVYWPLGCFLQDSPHGGTRSVPTSSGFIRGARGHLGGVSCRWCSSVESGSRMQFEGCFLWTPSQGLGAGPSRTGLGGDLDLGMHRECPQRAVRRR